MLLTDGADEVYLHTRLDGEGLVAFYRAWRVGVAALSWLNNNSRIDSLICTSPRQLLSHRQCMASSVLAASGPRLENMERPARSSGARLSFCLHRDKIIKVQL